MLLQLINVVSCKHEQLTGGLHLPDTKAYLDDKDYIQGLFSTLTLWGLSFMQTSLHAMHAFKPYVYLAWFTNFHTYCLLSPASCVSAGFTSCCTGSECGVGNCFCDQGCFGLDNCCSDITQVPCFPGMNVGGWACLHTSALCIYAYCYKWQRSFVKLPDQRRQIITSDTIHLFYPPYICSFFGRYHHWIFHVKLHSE